MGKRAIIRWNLNSYNNAGAVIAAIKSDVTFPEGAGYTSIAPGLRKACSEMFTAANGGRQNVPHVAILATDGFSNVDVDDTIPAARACWDAGVNVFAIGVTPTDNEQQLSAISSPPHELSRNYWLTEDYVSLQSILSSVKNVTCALPGL